MDLEQNENSEVKLLKEKELECINMDDRLALESDLKRFNLKKWVELTKVVRFISSISTGNVNALNANSVEQSWKDHGKVDLLSI